MKRTFVILLLLGCVCITSFAQSENDYEIFKRQTNSQYSLFKNQSQQEYAAFRKKANAEYALHVQQAWVQMHLQQGEQPPAQPKPSRPPIVAPDRLPSLVIIPFDDFVPKLREVPLPELPIAPEPEPTAPTMQIAFYGTSLQIHAGEELRFKLSSVSEKGVADAWRMLSTEKYDGILHDCLAQRQQLHLCDWGYIMLTQAVANQLLGASNEATLLQMFLLTQSGMKVRLAKRSGRFVLLVPFDETVYNYTYVYHDGTRYYALDKSSEGSLSVCDVVYPQERVASIRMTELPKFKVSSTQSRKFESSYYSSVDVNICTNKNLIDFLNDYPLSSAWNLYALASLSDEVKSQLYPVLRSKIKGKSQKEAVEMLLNFVQTAFDYKTDQAQFGTERPLFGDESFYYPYNDCEDRSILFSILVRELVGLDVVLLNYPGHLATAVRFTEDVKGDYLTVNDKKYVVCDPTYINASVGMSMPQFKDVSIKVVEI